MSKRRFFRCTANSFRYYVTGKPAFDFTGRKILKPMDLDTEELKSIIWTAIELKTIHETTRSIINVVKGARMTLLLKQTNMHIELPACKAAQMLNAHLYVLLYPTWDETEFFEDTGKYIGLYSDILFFQSRYQSKTDVMAERLTVPVINIQNARFRILRGLTDMMTLQIKYGYLKGLNLAWIGPATVTFNTYLAMAPKLGLNVSFFCHGLGGSLISPANLHDATQICQGTLTNLQECHDHESAIKNAHVIATSMHEDPSMKISLDMLKHADPNWSVLHALPRGAHEIDPMVLNHKNCLIWESAQNSTYVWAALMIRLLTHYNHITERPNFERSSLTK